MSLPLSIKYNGARCFRNFITCFVQIIIIIAGHYHCLCNLNLLSTTLVLFASILIFIQFFFSFQFLIIRDLIHKWNKLSAYALNWSHKIMEIVVIFIFRSLICVYQSISNIWCVLNSSKNRLYKQIFLKFRIRAFTI